MEITVLDFAALAPVSKIFVDSVPKQRVPIHVCLLLIALAPASCTPHDSSTGDSGDIEETDAQGQTCSDDGREPCDTGVNEHDGQKLCEESGWECGAQLGVSCGSCDQNERCESGKCICHGECDGTRCNDDGCGLCPGDQNCLDGTCLGSQNCNNCPLVLSLYEKVFDNGHLTGAILTLDYTPTQFEPRPRLFDLYLTVDKNADLVGLAEGPALTDAGKSLARHESTGESWVRSGNQLRFVALSAGNTDTLSVGRIMTLEFEINTTGNVSFRISRRDQIFAPAEADGALQLSDYDGEVVVAR